MCLWDNWKSREWETGTRIGVKAAWAEMTWNSWLFSSQIEPGLTRSRDSQ